MRFADRLKFLRERMGMHQAEMADKLNISKSTYHNYESGRREPDIETIKYISGYFDVTLDFLLGKTDNMQGVLRYDIPKELKDVGIEYLVVARQAKDLNISPADIEQMLLVINAYRSTKKDT